MRKESRRNCDRFGECRGVIFIIKTIGLSVGVGTGFSFTVYAAERASRGTPEGDTIRMRADGYGPNVMSNGCIPTLAIVAATVSDGILMTVTVVLLVSDTYSFVWSELICDMKGPCPAGIVARTVCVRVSMTETLSEYVLDTKAFVPSAVITSSHGYCPVGMVATTVKCGGIDDRDIVSPEVARVNLLAVGRNSNSLRT